MDAMTYCELFMEKIFYFSLRKTSNEHDAEELAAEIGCEVLAALGRGAQPEHFRAWVWQIARNRWARWAQKRYGKREAGMEEIAGLAAEENVEQSAVRADELRRLRRALAFVRSEYRTLIVAHYFQGKRVSDIAREMRLPVGTVKTRLARSRRELKEGMDMAREFGRRSFAPENVDFVNACDRFGANGQPWTILEHLMYKNIFLELYHNPETAETLSLELGVALPYMEAELDFLTRETFLKKTGDRYETAFPIISREARERMAERWEAVTPELTRLMAEEIDLYGAACERMGEPIQGSNQTWEDAKWTLLMRAVDVHWWAVGEQKQRSRTQRPDGGTWDIVGFQTIGREAPMPVGQHGGYMTEQQNLPFVSFNAYRFAVRDIQQRTKPFYDHPEIFALQLVCEGKAELCEQKQLDQLLQDGLIRREGERYTPCLLIFRDGDGARRYGKLTEAERETLHGLSQRIEERLRQLRAFTEEALRDDLPEAFRADDGLRAFITDMATNQRGYVLEEALRTGWLKDDEATCRIVGAWINV